jgi:hypothetical protein
MSPSPDFNRRRDGIVTRSTRATSLPRAPQLPFVATRILASGTADRPSAHRLPSLSLPLVSQRAPQSPTTGAFCCEILDSVMALLRLDAQSVFHKLLLARPAITICCCQCRVHKREQPDKSAQAKPARRYVSRDFPISTAFLQSAAHLHFRLS